MSSVVASEIMSSESLASDTDRVWLRRTGVEETPRRPRIIMEGPLVSDTTEVLSGAAPASEDPPIGQTAAGSAAAAAAPRSGRDVVDLSKLLVPDLQRVAQQLGISGTGRMRKGDLIAAIKERQGGGRAANPGRQSSQALSHGGLTASHAAQGGRTPEAPDESATRVASAGAGASRPLNQDAMEADTSVRSGIGDAAHGGIGEPQRGAGAGTAGIGDGQARAASAQQTAQQPA